jgi:hypothetical protein
LGSESFALEQKRPKSADIFCSDNATDDEKSQDEFISVITDNNENFIAFESKQKYPKKTFDLNNSFDTGIKSQGNSSSFNDIKEPESPNLLTPQQHVQLLLPSHFRHLRLKHLSLRSFSRPKRSLKDFFPLPRWHSVSRRRRLDIDIQQLHHAFKEYERQNKIKAITQFFEEQ